MTKSVPNNEMWQTSIQFFWPLTEQTKLDLDFTPCEEYEKQKREQQRDKRGRE